MPLPSADGGSAGVVRSSSSREAGAYPGSADAHRQSRPVDDASYREEPRRRRSGSSGDACLGGMQVTYPLITILAALANGYAAALNFVGAESVKVVADRVRVSRKSMVPLGTLLALGAVGLLAGFALPALGTAAGTSMEYGPCNREGGLGSRHGLVNLRRGAQNGRTITKTTMIAAAVRRAATSGAMRVRSAVLNGRPRLP